MHVPEWSTAASGHGVGGGRRGMAAHAMINEVLVAFDPFNKLLKLKNAQEYGKLFYSSWKGNGNWGGRGRGVEFAI